MSPLSIRVDEYGEARVRFAVDRETAIAASRALSSSDRFAVCDHSEDWASYEGRGFGRWLSASVSLYEDLDVGETAHVEVFVVATLDGDDRFDHTKAATELSLDDLLLVAAAARLIFGIEPGRFAWANARRVADDHALEVESLAAEAGRAVVAKLERRAQS